MENNQIKKREPLRPYSENNFSKFSPRLFNKSYRTNLGFHSQKLLFGLAASLTEDSDLFPVWEVPISKLFQYLNLSEDNNDRYRIVRETIREIASSVLELEVSDKKWHYLTWFNEASFDEERSDIVHFEFSSKVKTFLLQLKEFCLLESKYYIDLSSDYSMWLYPLLRNAANKKNAQLILSIDEIKKLTFNEKTITYNHQKNKNANRDLLKWVIGIEKKRGSKVYTPRIEKKKDICVETGAISEINQKTDLYVTCEVRKNGRSISHVVFNISFKGNTFQGKRKAIKTTHRTAYNDPSKKERRLKEIKEKDLFDFSLPIETVKQIAKDAGMTLSEYLQKSGYEQQGNFAVKI